jgi:ubiquinone/menaquinone biosynthesis C-methylase UbiE
MAVSAMRDAPRAKRPDEPLQYACPCCRTNLDLSVQDGRCPKCGFQPRRIADVFSFANAFEPDRWQRLFEDQAAKAVDDTISTICYRCQLQHKYMIESFRRLCTPLPAEARALDVGCGNGMLWAEVFGTPNVVGIDYALGMCQLARARGMLAHHANALALPFADAQFDLVYSAEAVQYVPDLRALLAELARVCRRGGRIVISTLNRRSALRRMVLAAKAAVGQASANDPVYLRTAADVASAADGLPLSVEWVWWIHFPFPQLLRTGTTERCFEWLATNVIVRLVKDDA